MNTILKNFGFADEVTVLAPGINGKMNEFQSALGLLQLRYTGEVQARRQAIDRRYREALGDVPGISLLAIPPDTRVNHAYFPVLVGPGYPLSRDALYERLRAADILVRRYFYPLISNLPIYHGQPSAVAANLPQANLVSQRILCLPIHPDLSEPDQQRVIDLVRGAC